MPARETVDLLTTPDPARAFAEAHRTGALLALRTSGTAARPRTVVRTTDSWVDSFPHVSSLLGVDATSRVWVPGPATATMNLFAVAHTAWAGAEQVDRPHGATHAHLTASALRRAIADDPTSLAAVHVVTAGDRLERATWEAAGAAGVSVSHYYGAAELSFVAWGDHAEALRPFPGVEVASRDGELWVRSPYVALGYAEPDVDLRRGDDGWLTVGDRGRVADGLVHVHGRDGGITTSGATVLVADIEPVLRARAAGEVVVVGLPHPDLGEVVVAVVTRGDDVPRLRSVSREVLTPAQQPRRWLELDPLPLTPAGKIDRAAVVEAVTATRASA